MSAQIQRDLGIKHHCLLTSNEIILQGVCEEMGRFKFNHGHFHKGSLKSWNLS